MLGRDILLSFLDLHNSTRPCMWVEVTAVSLYTGLRFDMGVSKESIFWVMLC
jgi:hypothetical protein